MIYASLLHFLCSSLECLLFALDFVTQDYLLSWAGHVLFGVSHRYWGSLLTILDRLILVDNWVEIGVKARFTHSCAERIIAVVGRGYVCVRDLDFARGLLLAWFFNLNDGLEELTWLEQKAFHAMLRLLRQCIDLLLVLVIVSFAHDWCVDVLWRLCHLSSHLLRRHGSGHLSNFFSINFGLWRVLQNHLNELFLHFSDLV